MEKRLLGKTNFLVSSVGFGGIPIQRLNKDQAVELVEEAHRQGINFIDTARGYVESESLLGHALSIVGRDKFILATKSMKRDYRGLVDEFNTSLENLRVGHVDLFQFHNVRTEDELNIILGEDGALRAVREFQKAGKIRELGISSHSVDLLLKAIEMDIFTTIQYPYNPVETQGSELFKKAKEKNIGVIVMKPLAGGAIGKGELSLRFVLENKNVSVAIPGMQSIEEIRENVRPGIDKRGLTEDERRELMEEASSLGREFCRRCGYCAPCSVGIDIPSQFLMEGYHKRYNLQDWAKERYDLLEKKAGECIECGDCEPRCPYDLPIIKMLKEVDRVLG